jgi:hypothetical protein
MAQTHALSIRYKKTFAFIAEENRWSVEQSPRLLVRLGNFILLPNLPKEVGFADFA